MEEKKERINFYLFSSRKQSIKKRAKERGETVSEYINNLVEREMGTIQPRYYTLLKMMYDSPNIHINRDLIINLGNSSWFADRFIKYCLDMKLISLIDYEQTNERLRLSKKITNKHKCYGLTLRGVDICKELTKKFK